MRTWLLGISGLLAAVAPAALAQASSSDTLQAITTNGMVLTISGFDIDMSFSADHRFTAMDGALTGKWRTDGNRLCTTGDADAIESCTEYPEGKKPGDAFQVTDPKGVVFGIRIK